MKVVLYYINMNSYVGLNFSSLLFCLISRKKKNLFEGVDIKLKNSI